MRSLYRQNIKGANSIEKDGKYKDYRMLYLLHKKRMNCSTISLNKDNKNNKEVKYEKR